MLKRPDTVEVLGIVEDKILVINDEQPHRGLRVSFPGGRVDKGEDVLQAAKREVEEETGHVFKNWRLVKVWQPHTKVEWFIDLFIAWDVRELVRPHLDGGEKISTKLIDFAAVKELVDSKVGHLGEASALFETTHSIAELLALPEYTGKSVNR
jgi:ADP-ribose pyrophosphatase